MAAMAKVFDIVATDGNARAGVLHTAHGKVETPFFMPVATKGAVKQISGDDLISLETDALISNSLLLHLKPGSDYLKKIGGIHGYMNYGKCVFTDSGGFQMLSKTLFCGIDDEGVSFKNPYDGKIHKLSPEDVMDIENDIGCDVAMVLDHVSNWGESYEAFKESLLRTMRWAERCKRYHDENCDPKQLLFGIVQGGLFKDLK
jgi:queuine tRNA-ribosyltransferase